MLALQARKNDESTLLRCYMERSHVTGDFGCFGDTVVGHSIYLSAYAAKEACPKSLYESKQWFFHKPPNWMHGLRHFHPLIRTDIHKTV